MGRQHDRLLPAQQSREHRASAGRQRRRQIGGQQRQRARQYVREDQIVAPSAHPQAAVARCAGNPHPCRNPVAHAIAAGDLRRPRVDVARRHPDVPQLCRGDRQNPGTGPDIERMAKATPRQGFEGDQAGAGRGMLAGAECSRRIDRNTDGSRRRAAPMVRAVDEKLADPQRREGELVFGEPVALRQCLLAQFDKRTAGGGGGERQPGGERRREHGRPRIGLDPPLVSPGFKGRYRRCGVVQ